MHLSRLLDEYREVAHRTVGATSASIRESRAAAERFEIPPQEKPATAIRCNSIHPAAILTPMWEPMLGGGADREERIRTIVKDTPLQRFGRVDEVAAVAVLLASDEAAYMTGSEINIDGGLLAGSAASPKRREI